MANVKFNRLKATLATHLDEAQIRQIKTLLGGDASDVTSASDLMTYLEKQKIISVDDVSALRTLFRLPELRGALLYETYVVPYGHLSQNATFEINPFAHLKLKLAHQLTPHSLDMMKMLIDELPPRVQDSLDLFNFLEFRGDVNVTNVSLLGQLLLQPCVAAANLYHEILVPYQNEIATRDANPSYRTANIQSLGSQPSEKSQKDNSRSEAQNADECAICFDGEREIALQPCGHKCLCTNCSEGLEICPICRTKIQGTLKVFDC